MVKRLPTLWPAAVGWTVKPHFTALGTSRVQSQSRVFGEEMPVKGDVSGLALSGVEGSS